MSVQCGLMVERKKTHLLITTGHTVVYLRFGDLVAKINGSKTVVAKVMSTSAMR